MSIITIRSVATSSVLLIITFQLLLAPANSIPTVDTMNPGDTLLTGKSLTSGEYSLNMQGDCNLVLRRGDNPTWESGTAGKGSECFLYLQRNGLLLIYSEKHNTAIWKAETVQSLAGGSFVFVLRPDGNAVVFGTPVWSTEMVGKKY